MQVVFKQWSAHAAPLTVCATDCGRWVATLPFCSRDWARTVLTHRRITTEGGGATIRRFGASWMVDRAPCRLVCPPGATIPPLRRVVDGRGTTHSDEGRRAWHPRVEEQRQPAVGRECEKSEVVAVLMATQPLAKRRIGWAHAERYNAEGFDGSCCTDAQPRCAEAADRGTPAHWSITPTLVKGPHRGFEDRRAIVPPAVN
jgi:hypothetical protein